MMQSDLIQGLSQALLAGVFSVSAMGKVVGCQRSGGAMCKKGGLDLGLAALAVLASWTPAALLLGAGALAIGAGGWLRERVRGDTICNCFGVLTPALHRWRNHVRAVLAASAAMLLAARLAAGAPAVLSPAYLAGLAMAGMAVMLGYSYVHAAAVPRIKKIQASPLQRGQAALAAGQPLLRRQDGSAVTLEQMQPAQGPLALLFTSDGCAQCSVIKEELAPLREALPFPLHVVVSGAATGELNDVDGSLRRHYGLEGVPSMVLIDPVTRALAAPVAFGSAEIYRELLRGRAA
jgi:hypothetical protein